MSMEKFAKIGCLTIQYIQDLDLDNSVGIEPNGMPQIWYIPEIPKEEVDSIETERDSKRIFRKYAISEVSKHEVDDLMRTTRKNIQRIKESIENSML